MSIEIQAMRSQRLRGRIRDQHLEQIDAVDWYKNTLAFFFIKPTDDEEILGRRRIFRETYENKGYQI